MVPLPVALLGDHPPVPGGFYLRSLVKTRGLDLSLVLQVGDRFLRGPVECLIDAMLAG